MPPEFTVKVHQYLYYVLATPLWSDYQYDRFCHEHGIPGGGGSDRASDYSADVIAAAKQLMDIHGL